MLLHSNGDWLNCNVVVLLAGVPKAPLSFDVRVEVLSVVETVKVAVEPGTPNAAAVDATATGVAAPLSAPVTAAGRTVNGRKVVGATERTAPLPAAGVSIEGRLGFDDAESVPGVAERTTKLAVRIETAVTLACEDTKCPTENIVS
jgi:hypothetical protein